MPSFANASTTGGITASLIAASNTRNSTAAPANVRLVQSRAVDIELSRVIVIRAPGALRERSVVRLREVVVGAPHLSDFDLALPFGPVLPAELHEALRRRERLLPRPVLEDREAADDLLRLRERAVENLQLPLRDADLGAAGRGRIQPAPHDQRAVLRGLVGQLLDRLDHLRRRHRAVLL